MSGAPARPEGSPDVRVCFFGDSFTAGVGDPTALGWVGRVVARARRDGHLLTGYNLGVRLETSLDVAARFEAEAAVRLRHGDRHGGVLSFGVNDTAPEGTGQRVPTAGTLAALRRCVDTATAHGWRVLVVGPALVADAAHNERIRALSTAMADEGRRLGVAVVELAPALSGDVEWMSQAAATDGWHPGGSGYERLAALVWPGFEAWLQQRNSFCRLTLPLPEA